MLTNLVGKWNTVAISRAHFTKWGVKLLIAIISRPWCSQEKNNWTLLLIISTILVDIVIRCLKRMWSSCVTFVFLNCCSAYNLFSNVLISSTLAAKIFVHTVGTHAYIAHEVLLKKEYNGKVLCVVSLIILHLTYCFCSVCMLLFSTWTTCLFVKTFYTRTICSHA